MTALIMAGPAEPAPVFPGKISQWNGFQRFDFKVADTPAIVVVPSKPAAGKPWIWRTEFFDHRPEIDLALVKHGY
ncbi:MAG: alpha/beta hydrolase, partial [Planctomycetota bacterium]